MELYVHIPFCRSKCRYCDFASWPGQDARMPAYVDALLAEADAARAELGEIPMETAFLGGGTPSTLPPALLDRLLGGLLARFPLTPGAEFTTEANPGTLTPAWLDTARRHGVNRLSMGMQAAQPELLRALGRIHTFAEVEASAALARRAGLEELSLDLMFGLPGQTRAMWRESLEAALSLHPTHLSCYGLIPEEGTPLVADLDAGRLALPDEDEERQMYDDALTLLAARGFRQYEISNFALPGHECRHNLGYWRQVPYLGLGASASSMLPDRSGASAYVRRTNPRGLADYEAMVRDARWDMRETEAISPAEARFETLMLGLRTTLGVREADFAAMHGVPLDACYGERLRAQEAAGLLAHEAGRWFLTRRGMDVQNTVLVALMD